MEKNHEDKSKRPSDWVDDVEIGPVMSPQPGPDGMPAPIVGIGVAPPPPEPTPENSPCLRGPCRHYWHLVTHFDAGNADVEQLREAGFQFRDNHRICLVNPGFETDLTGDIVYECTRWEPESPEDVAQRNERRRRYFDKHPEHKDNA